MARRSGWTSRRLSIRAASTAPSKSSEPLRLGASAEDPRPVFWITADKASIHDGQEQAQNAKQEVETRHLKRALIPVEEVSHRGSERGSAFRTVVSRVHRTAPSLVGHSVEVIETRRKEEEDEVLKQLHTLAERMEQWQGSATA